MVTLEIFGSIGIAVIFFVVGYIVGRHTAKVEFTRWLKTYEDHKAEQVLDVIRDRPRI